MSAVVLRCPHCGTTRGTPGECEACHEASVRYYCTNHNPGRWLDAPACAQCGARFGEPLRRPATTVSPPAPIRPPPAPVTRPEGRRAAAPRPPGRPTSPADEAADRERRPPAAGERRLPPGRGRAPHATSWEELLRHAARSRYEGAGRPRPVPLPEVRAPRLGGCLLRLVLLLLLMMFAAFSGLFIFAGSLFQLFRFY